MIANVTMQKVSKMFMVSACAAVTFCVTPEIIKAEVLDITPNTKPFIKITKNKKNIQNTLTTVIHSNVFAYTKDIKRAPEVRILNKEVTKLDRNSWNVSDLFGDMISDYYPKINKTEFVEFEEEFVEFESSNRQYHYISDAPVTTFDIKKSSRNDKFYKF